MYPESINQRSIFLLIHRGLPIFDCREGYSPLVEWYVGPLNRISEVPPDCRGCCGDIPLTISLLLSWLPL